MVDEIMTGYRYMALVFFTLRDFINKGSRPLSMDRKNLQWK